jgi:Zn-dependent peptidase ImmA (M78 family)
VPVEQIVARLGVSLHKVRDGGWDGALKSTSDAAHIWIDENKPSVRQRFTIAHELGHLMLHPLGEMYRDCLSARGTDPKEVEANAYAAELLIPGWMLRAYVQATIDVAKLAKVFDVSERVMAIRLQSYFRL